MVIQHQRQTNKILGNRVAELEKKLRTLEVSGLWSLPGGKDTISLHDPAPPSLQRPKSPVIAFTEIPCHTPLTYEAHRQPSLDLCSTALEMTAKSETNQQLENSQDPLGNAYENMYLHPLIPLFSSEKEQRGKQIVELADELSSVELEESLLQSPVDNQIVSISQDPLASLVSPLSSPGLSDTTAETPILPATDSFFHEMQNTNGGLSENSEGQTKMAGLHREAEELEKVEEIKDEKTKHCEMTERDSLDTGVHDDEKC
ncbi:Hypothetical predicted protein [Pelobates cultripes]|uniref:Uncharacterized protein n=1 Tax=Pelobates cultripes TaxID=61616 RepID=A0AAD1WA87_PELCU|nr:Hypothetical predicted protein [Pelobates cultripes]